MRVIISTCLFLLFYQITLAQNCLPGWDYFRTVTINNPTAESLTDIQVRIDFDSKSLVDSAKLQTDGADLRILDESCNPIPFFIENVATESTNAIWVKLASLPANGAVSLQLYYGNDTSLTAINGDETFIFFDDFSADVVDLDKWQSIGGFASFQVTDGVLEYASNGANPGPRFKFARTKAVFSEEVVFDFKAQISNSNGFGFSSADSVLDRLIFRQSGFGFDTLNQVAFNKDTVNNGFSISQVYPLIRYPRGEFRDASIQAGIQENELTLTHFANLNDSSMSLDTFRVIQTEMTGFHFILSSFINGSIFLDYLRVRKPIPDAVNSSLGPEEMIIQSSISFPGYATEVEVFPNPAHKFVWIRGLQAGEYSFRIIGLQGQELLHKRQRLVSEEDLQLAIPAIPAAMYWLVITDESRHVARATPIVIRNQ